MMSNLGITNILIELFSFSNKFEIKSINLRQIKCTQLIFLGTIILPDYFLPVTLAGVKLGFKAFIIVVFLLLQQQAVGEGEGEK